MSHADAIAILRQSPRRLFQTHARRRSHRHRDDVVIARRLRPPLVRRSQAAVELMRLVTFLKRGMTTSWRGDFIRRHGLALAEVK